METVTPRVRALEEHGIGSILDYAAETDVVQEKGAETYRKERRKKDVMSARTFAYEGEEQCEENKKIFMSCIDHVSAASPDAFAAVKSKNLKFGFYRLTRL